MVELPVSGLGVSKITGCPGVVGVGVPSTTGF